MSDEIIQEVHAIKDAIGAKFKYNLQALFEALKCRQAEFQDNGVKIVHPPTDSTQRIHSELQKTRSMRITADLVENGSQP